MLNSVTARKDRYLFVNMQQAIDLHISPHLEEDNHMYALQKKSKLMRRFIVYRVCNFLLQIVTHAREKDSKPVLFVQKKLCLQLAPEQELYLLNQLRTVCKILGICVYVCNKSMQDFLCVYDASGGEGREVRNTVKSAVDRVKRINNLDNFYNLLSRNGIYKIPQQINTNIQLKLALFVT